MKRRPGKGLALHPLKCKCWRAQNLVEFAIAVPIFILFAFGAIDLARVFHAVIAISNAAREGARYGISYGINRDDYSIKETDIINATLAETSDMGISNATVVVSCPEVCGPGKPLSVDVCYNFDFMIVGSIRIIDSVLRFPGPTLTLCRDVDMMIP